MYVYIYIYICIYMYALLYPSRVGCAAVPCRVAGVCHFHVSPCRTGTGGGICGWDVLVI